MTTCFINSFENDNLNFKSVAFVFTIISFIFFISLFLEIYFLAKLKISENVIENQTILFNKKTLLLYTEIKNIELHTERSFSERGYINDGYPVSIVNFKNGSKLVISSDCYENYKDLIIEIKTNLNNQHVA